MGNDADARKYTDLAASIRKAFNEKFYHPDTGLYGNGSQTSLSCALYQGLVEPANKARVLSNLVAAVEKANGHIDTGILGAKYLLNALLENGRADVAYRIASQKDLPSWGWWLEQGATTLWEQWNGTESRNHIMFGDISAWFYKALAGINLDPAVPAFKHFIIKPNLVGGLTSARAAYDSVRGRIVSDWKIKDGRFSLTVTIPANTTATVYVPAASSAAIMEDSKPAADCGGSNDSCAWKTAAACLRPAPAPTTSPRPCSRGVCCAYRSATASCIRRKSALLSTPPESAGAHQSCSVLNRAPLPAGGVAVRKGEYRAPRVTDRRGIHP